MSGSGISTVPLPENRYRPDLISYSDERFQFETEQFSREEDARRVKMLRKSASQAKKPENRIAALELADRLDYGDGDPPETLASHLYMRGHRIAIAGALWRLAERPDFGQVSIVGIAPRSLEIPGESLWQVDPRKAGATVRTDLYNCGAKTAGGYAAAFFDAEHEPMTDMFRFHFHGLAAGGMLDVIEGLRAAPKYRSIAVREGHRKRVPRIVVSRKPLENLPAPLTYLLKSFYSSKWEGQIDGERRRQNRKSRIKEPRHSQVLLWLDRWSLQDITLLLGLRVNADGFHLTKPKTYTNGEGR